MIQQTTALWLAALAIAAATRRSRARLAMGWVAAAPLCLALSPIASAQPVPDDPRYTEIGQHDPEKGTLQGSPTDEGNLPSHIRKLTDTGMRPDWSPDGARIIHLDGNLGD